MNIEWQLNLFAQVDVLPVPVYRISSKLPSKISQFLDRIKKLNAKLRPTHITLSSLDLINKFFSLKEVLLKKGTE